MELISIIVPIYKVQDYLKRCVDSILSQNYTNLQVILVNDGSPDNCSIICDEYAARDARINVIHKKNGGLSDARNAGMEIAKGSVIAFIDSDDWISPHYVETMYQVMLEQEADIVECEILKTDGTKTLPVSASMSETTNYNTTEALERLIKDNEFHQYVWNKLYRREVIEHVLFEYGKYNEDEFWTYQVFGNSKKISKVSAILYAYFQRPGSIMGQTYSIKRLDGIEGKIKRQKYIDKHFGSLSAVAMMNLAGSMIYAGQMSLKCLSGVEKNKALHFLKSEYAKLDYNGQVKRILPVKQRVWISMAKVSFIGTCELKNYLGIGL